MHKILIIDDDENVRALHRLRLSEQYEIVETGEPENALSLALQHKPSAILLDLMMPKCSGFELCESLHSLSYTSMIPIVIITGESSDKYRTHCESLGARAFFEKPVDYKQLKDTLAAEILTSGPDRRAHVRVRMKVVLTLRGIDSENSPFEVSCMTENASAGGFLCSCPISLVKDSQVDVFLKSEPKLFVGKARVVRRVAPSAPWQQYGLEFVETSNNWLLRP